MKVNIPSNIYTHQGAKAVEVNAYDRLKRTVLACLLFEDNFYEDGMKAADRITELCAKCTPIQILDLAIISSSKYHLRHIPLQLIVESLKFKDKPLHIANTAEVIEYVCKRPDQCTDLLALYWKKGKCPIANQLKKGLAKAFTKWDSYSLSKYRNG